MLVVAFVIGGASVLPAFVSGKAPPAPNASTGDASVSIGGAHLRGTVNPNGSATTYGFRYGTTTDYGRHSPSQSLPAGSAPVDVSADIADLEPGARYHYRVIATNSFGTVEGEDRTFVVPAARLAGRYAARVRVTAGGRPFDQGRGDGGPREYNFKPACSGGGIGASCTEVSLRRAGQRGKFTSVLRQTSSDRWSGRESFHGYCDNGLEFRSRTQIHVLSSGHRGLKVDRISGDLRTRVRGCISGSERATFKGQLR